MVWLLIIGLCGVVVIASLTLLLLVDHLTEEAGSELLVELQTRQVERQLHDIARSGFERMLQEARSQSSTVAR